MTAKPFSATLLFILLALTSSQALPITFESLHTHNTFRFKLHLEPNTEIKLFSQKFVPSHDHWTTLHSFGSDITFSQPLAPQAILYNQQHDGKYTLAYHVSIEAPSDHKRHFHYVNTEYKGKQYGLLLPSFASEVRAIRTDRLFRCSNTLVSVEWIAGDAHIVAVSLHERWKILQSIDGGFVSEDRDVQYGYAVDQAHEHPVRIQIAGNGHCLISQDTKPAVISYNWSKENYDISTIIDLVGESLPIIPRKLPGQNQL